MKGGRKMKRLSIAVFVGCLFLVALPAYAQLDRLVDKILEGVEQTIRPEYLKVVRLEMSPDPVREGQRMAFRAVISNSSRNSGRVTIAVRDRDQIISELRNAIIRPGDNIIDFPETVYRFTGTDRCFTVEADIERTRTPIDVATEFCARKTYSGWTLSDKGVGPLYVELLDMYPDPVSPGQEVRFAVKLRNDGRPIRGHIRIMDRDQVVVQIDNAFIPRGLTEFHFPRNTNTFQRFDACFAVIVDIDRTPYPVDASRKYCARPITWTLRPVP